MTTNHQPPATVPDPFNPGQTVTIIPVDPRTLPREGTGPGEGPCGCACADCPECAGNYGTRRTQACPLFGDPR